MYPVGITHLRKIFEYQIATGSHERSPENPKCVHNPHFSIVESSYCELKASIIGT